MKKIIELAKDNRSLSLLLSGFIMLLSLSSDNVNSILVFLIYILWITLLIFDISLDYIKNIYDNIIRNSFWKVFTIYLVLVLLNYII